MSTSTQPATYIVVHTIGGEYNDVEAFEDLGTGFTYAYTDAVDLAAAIREHDGHWARIDKVYADGSRGIL